MKNKGAIGVIVVIAAAAAAWLGFSEYTGVQLEQQINQELAFVQSQSPLIKVVERTHRRGLFSSDGRIVLGLNQACAAQMAQRPGLASLRVAYIYHTVHGPYAQGFGMAHIDMRIEAEGNLKTMLQQNGVAPVLMRVGTHIDFARKQHSGVDIPAWTLRFADGSALDWRGLRGVVDGDAATPRSLKFQLNGPGFALTTAKGSLALAGLSLSGDMQYVNPRLALGKMDFNVEKISAGLKGQATPLQMQGLAIGTETHADTQGLLDIAMRLHIRSGQGNAGFWFKNARYDMALHRIDGPTYLQLDQFISRRFGCLPSTTQPAQLQADLRAAAKLALKLLASQPELELKSVGAQTSMGDFDLSATISAPNIEEQDFAAPPRLLQKLRVRAKLEVPLAMASSNPFFSPLLEQAYVTQDDKAVRTDFLLAQGTMSLNGKVFDPAIFAASVRAPAPTQMPPSGAPLLSPHP